jgi:serine/threonine protein kinase
LNHCHSKRIIHRDIKPQNILVDRANEIVRLADFGLTRHTLMDAETPLTPEVVTLWYRSPELLLSGKYSWSVDMWSLGCVVGEMAGGRPLFRADSEIGVIFEIFKCAASLLPHAHGLSVPHLFRRLLGTPDVDSPLRNMKDFCPAWPKWTMQDLNARYGARIGDKGVDLLTQMLDYDGHARIDTVAALNHPYLYAAPE